MRNPASKMGESSGKLANRVYLEKCQILLKIKQFYRCWNCFWLMQSTIWTFSLEICRSMVSVSIICYFLALFVCDSFIEAYISSYVFNSVFGIVYYHN